MSDIYGWGFGDWSSRAARDDVSLALARVGVHVVQQGGLMHGVPDEDVFIPWLMAAIELQDNSDDMTPQQDAPGINGRNTLRARTEREIGDWGEKTARFLRNHPAVAELVDQFLREAASCTGIEMIQNDTTVTFIDRRGLRAGLHVRGDGFWVGSWRNNTAHGREVAAPSQIAAAIDFLRAIPPR